MTACLSTMRVKPQQATAKGKLPYPCRVPRFGIASKLCGGTLAGFHSYPGRNPVEFAGRKFALPNPLSILASLPVVPRERRRTKPYFATPSVRYRTAAECK